MSDLTSLFDALYTRLLLRDFFGKIVPGSFIILAIVISLPPYSDLYFRDGKMLRVHVILALAIFLGVGMDYCVRRSSVWRDIQTH